MNDRIEKKELIHRLAKKMNVDEKTATDWLNAVIETLYEAFKQGLSVTIPGFGGFYVKRKGSSWAFKFNPGQKLRKLFGWTSTYKGPL